MLGRVAQRIVFDDPVGACCSKPWSRRGNPRGERIALVGTVWLLCQLMHLCIAEQTAFSYTAAHGK
jgi:hypothetical protein